MDLGGGTPAYVDVELNQDGIKEEALAAIKKRRQDALDTNVPWPDRNGDTMKDYLAKKGISEEDYLNPRWSTSLEIMAIQRYAEIETTGLRAHKRPNGDRPTFTRDKIRSTSEVIAWGSGTVAGAIAQWSAEKSNYLKGSGVAGHYTYLINPHMIQYGLAGNEKTWLGQGTWRENDRFAKLLPTDPKTAETGLKGAYTMQVNLGDKMVAEGANINVKEIPVGGTATAVATNKKYEEIDEHGIPVISFPDDRFTFRGKWTSDDPSIVEVSEDGALKGVKTGATKIHLTTENGKVFDFDITVTGAPTEEPTPEPTEEPTEEPTQEPTEEPTEEPTQEPTEEPTEEPTQEPTEEPTQEPTQEPTEEPTQEPTEEPTEEPTQEPTQEPGDEPVEEHPGEQPDKPAKPGDEQAGASAGADEEVSGGGSNGSNGTASSAGKTMPRTGAAVLPIGLVAGAFIAAGVALLVAARRRA